MKSTGTHENPQKRVQRNPQEPSLYKSHSIGDRKLQEAIVFNIFAKYIDRNLQEPTRTHVKESTGTHRNPPCIRIMVLVIGSYNKHNFAKYILRNLREPTRTHVNESTGTHGNPPCIRVMVLVIGSYNKQLLLIILLNISIEIYGNLREPM